MIARQQSSALCWPLTGSLLIAVLLAAGLLLALPARARAAEQITTFDSTITINTDGSLDVVERIRLVSEGDQIKRGIVRSFPLRYVEPDGKWHPVGFQMLSVLRDGEPEQFREENLGQSVDVYIGQAEVFLEHGDHNYELHYRTDRMISFLQDFDELYFNITGNEWQLPILSASAALRLPQPVATADMYVYGYTGAYGSQAQDYRASLSRPGEAVINASRRLDPGEGLTVVLRWPKGVIPPPTAEQLAYEQSLRDAEAAALAEQAAEQERYRQMMAEKAERDRRGLDALSVAAVLLVMLIYLISWLAVGLDPSRGDPAALRAPPQDVSPAALRFIRNMKFDPLCFTTAVISLAAKGYLRISQDKQGDYSLQQLKKADPGLPEEESKLLSSLFNGASSRQVSSGNFTHFRKASDNLHNVLKQRYGKGFFRSNDGWRGFGACLSCSLGCGILVFGTGASVIFRSPIPIAAIVVLWLLNWAYGRLIPKYTPQGKTILEQFEPLRQALSGGQPVEMLMPSSAPMSPALFSQFLPYALAMDLQAAWAQQLEEQLKQAAQKAPPPVQGSVLQEQPGYYSGIDWYYNPYRRDYRYGQLVSNLSQSFNRQLSVASAPVVVSSGGSSSGGSSSSWSGSSYSGGGGGGFSGGGGGGGGGRGW